MVRQAVATLYEEKYYKCWFRAVIEEIHVANPDVTVYFLDYDNREMLNQDFGNFSAQAIRCSVGNVVVK